MKLIKYLIWILLLMGSLVFLVKLNELNQFDGNTLTINGQNWQVNRIIKEFKKFVSSNVQKENL